LKRYSVTMMPPIRYWTFWAKTWTLGAERVEHAGADHPDRGGERGAEEREHGEHQRVRLL
jgi:hypothetical protein